MEGSHINMATCTVRTLLLHLSNTMSDVRVVLITGCSEGGIGYALCKEYATHGYIVYATARRLESMSDLHHPNIRKLKLDVLEDDQVSEVIKTIVGQEGRIDILVNNAGSGAPGPVLDMTVGQVRRAFETNTFSVLRLSRAVAHHMATRKSGTIVTIGSIAADFPIPWNGVYSASKAATHLLMDSLWMECKPLGINVTLVAPGVVKSKIVEKSSALVQEPGDTLYTAHLPAIRKLFQDGQTGRSAMPTKNFAKKVVKETTKKNPPRYMTLGEGSFIVKILSWAPRAVVLALLWRKFSNV